MKIALLSNVTVEVLAGMLKSEHEVWTPSGFGAWMETALNPPSEMVAFAPVLICILIDRRFGAYDAAVQDLERARSQLAERFPKAAIVIPDVTRLAADFGDGFYDTRMWQLGKMPFSLRGLRELKKLFSVKKAIAVDLDDTLWKGVIGEEGVGGVEPDTAFQERLVALKRRGVLLVALSKNNPADVEPIWSDSRMTLHKEDFVAMTVDWNGKPGNLRRVAATLNLGMDAFVFVDDSSVERAQMRAEAPEVAVAAFPPELDAYFPPFASTAEDERKTEMYRAEARRRESAVGVSLEDYLKGLGMWATVHVMRDEEVARVAQLSQKTNQFNVCTNRYSEEEVASFVKGDGRLVITVCAGDRFGDYGLVAFVHVTLRGDGVAEIVDWVMSCRVMNRRLEFAVEGEVERLLGARGVRTIRAKWIATSRNSPVAELYDRLGFELRATDEGVRSYELRLPFGGCRRHCVTLRTA